MMKSIVTPAGRWMKVGALCAALGIAVLFAGDSRAEGKEKAAAKDAPAPAPEQPAANAPAPAKAGGDFVSLYEEEQRYRKSGNTSATTDEQFVGKWKALTEGLKPVPLSNGLEFVDASTQATGDKEYTFSFLFHVAAVPETNYHLNIYGTVCPYNAHYLAENQRETMTVQWNRYLKEEPTSQWKPGEYRVVQHKVESELIPYSLRLDLVTRGEKFEYTGLAGQVNLGWQWAVRDEKDLVAKIQACSDFASLHALAPAGPKVSADIAQALDAKWKALTEGMQPRTMIEGLDYLDIITKATGKNEYTFSFLFRPSAALKVDYHLSVTGKVDPSFRQYIKPAKPDAPYTSWPLSLYTDPTSQWKPGECHVGQIKVDTRIIPYNLSIVLQTRDAQGKWTGNPGNNINLGWQADVSE